MYSKMSKVIKFIENHRSNTEPVDWFVFNKLVQDAGMDMQCSDGLIEEYVLNAQISDYISNPEKYNRPVFERHVCQQIISRFVQARSGPDTF